MNWIDTGRVGLRYELSGQGPHQVVLLHEMGGTLETWDDIFPLLSREYRVLRFDTRGAGMSQKIQGDLTVQILADDLLSLLTALGIEGRVVLAGCAVGSAVAVCFAGRYPERTRGVMAMSPALGVAPERRKVLRDRVDELARAGVRTFREDALSVSYPKVLRALAPERFETFQARWLGNHVDSFAATYRMLINMELEDELAKISCPVMVVGGAHDQLRPPELCRKIAGQIPGAQFRILESGHHMPYQTPELVLELMNEFLGGLPE